MGRRSAPVTRFVPICWPVDGEVRSVRYRIAAAVIFLMAIGFVIEAAFFHDPLTRQWNRAVGAAFVSGFVALIVGTIALLMAPPRK